MIATALLALSLLAAPLPQSDRWVDPVNGSDQATGTTPSSAWKTLTRGLGLVAPGTTIKVLPGMLDVASGEDFPLEIPLGVGIESTGGADATQIVSTTAVAVLVLRRATRVEGFDIHGAGSAVVYGLNWHSNPVPAPAQLNRCRVTAQNGDAIVPQGMEMRECVVDSPGRAVTVLQWDFSAWDCVFRSGASNGCCLQFSNDVFASSSILLERCSVTSLGGCGVSIGEFNVGEPLHYRFANTEILDCGGDGIAMGSNYGRTHVLELEGCTIAGNGNAGINAFFNGSGVLDVFLRSSIVSGHSVVDVMGPVSATDSLIEDGSATGLGCLTGDPRFLDAANGDLQLRFDSPCKDVGLALGEGLDITRHTRSIDGDLNLIQAPDMGAYEHRTLVAPSSVLLGDPFDVGMTGPVNGFSFLVMDPNGLQQTPLSTPYGRLRVYGPTAQRLPPIVTTGGGPTFVTLPAFTDPAMVGLSAGFQALTRSTAAPNQAAFSNSGSVLVE